MFRIGEFSKLTQVSIRMLRYYDETGLLKPAEVDRFTNYRLYTAAQIPALNKIIFLRDLGFGVSDISAALSEWDDASITNLLENKRAQIQDTISALQDKLARIEQAKRDILKEKMSINYNVTIKSIPAYQVFSLRRVVPDYYAEGQLWEELSAYAQKHNIPAAFNTFTIYHDTDYREKNVDIEICSPVAALGESAGGFTFRTTPPVPIMACSMVYGSFENIEGAFLAIADWLGEHAQYEMAGESRQIVHRGPWNEESPDKYLTEIQIPLNKR